MISGSNFEAEKKFILLAASGSAADLKKFAAKNNINPDSDVFYGETAATVAARRGNVEIIDALFQLGADFTKTNKKGMTPEDVACDGGEACSEGLLRIRSVLSSGKTGKKKENETQRGDSQMLLF